MGKDKYEKILRANQKSKDKMKSDMRDAAMYNKQYHWTQINYMVK